MTGKELLGGKEEQLGAPQKVGEIRGGSERVWRRVFREDLRRGKDLGDPSALLTIPSTKEISSKKGNGSLKPSSSAV